MTPITTTRTAQSTRHHSTFREDFAMFHIELRLADIQERHERFRAIRDAERADLRSERSLRLQLGRSLMRLGRRIGGDAMTAPAWQG